MDFGRSVQMNQSPNVIEDPLMPQEAKGGS
jgi:hypothetical protein